MSNPSETKLRHYQVDALQGIMDAFADNDSTLLVCPTASGKTTIFVEAIKHFPIGRILILAHRQELIFQASARVKRMLGIDAEVEMGDAVAESSAVLGSRVVISTVQTQLAGERMRRFKPTDFRLCILDEAHHYAAPSFKRVLDYYRQNPDLKILGVTATPDRADEKALGAVFQSVAYANYQIIDGIEDGYLVPIRQRMVTVHGLDYSKISTTAGELNGAELRDVLEQEEHLHRFAQGIIEAAMDLGPGTLTPLVGLADAELQKAMAERLGFSAMKTTLVFTRFVHQAERLSEICNRWLHGCADWLCGKTPKDKREEMLKKYAAGAFHILCNVNVLSEGADEPRISVVVMAAPTKSRARYSQQVGRGLRPLAEIADALSHAETREDRLALIAGSGKQTCSILDFVGNSGRHHLMTTADILGGKPLDGAVSRRARELLEDGEEDPAAAAEQAQREAEAESLAELMAEKRRKDDEDRRRNLRVAANYSITEADPFGGTPITPWKEKPATMGKMASEKQMAFVRRFYPKVEHPELLTARESAQLIVEKMKEWKNKPIGPSDGMARILKQRGYDPDQMTFAQAKAEIGKIAIAEGWERRA